MDVTPMDVTVRPGTPGDAEACGTICYRAFKALAERHGFAPDFRSAEVAVGLLSGPLSHPGFHADVAEAGGRVVGSNFIDERSTIAGIGPITIDPEVQGRSLGRLLMGRALARTSERGVSALACHLGLGGSRIAPRAAPRLRLGPGRADLPSPAEAGFAKAGVPHEMGQYQGRLV